MPARTDQCDAGYLKPSRKEELARELHEEEEHAQRQNDGTRLLQNLEDAACAIHDQLSNELYSWFQHQGFWPENWEPHRVNGEAQVMQPNGQPPETITILLEEYIRLKKMEKLGLIVTEVAEAMEAVRKGDFENEKEELADVRVRLHDYEGGFGFTRRHLGFTNTAAESFFAKMRKNFQRPFRHGKKF